MERQRYIPPALRAREDAARQRPDNAQRQRETAGIAADVTRDMTLQQQRNLIAGPHQGVEPNSPVYIGAWDKGNTGQSGHLDNFMQSPNARFSILSPENFIPSESETKTNWSVPLNQAFIEGVLQSGRPVELVTPPDRYHGMREGLLNNGTFWEMTALQRHGYNFEPGTGNIYQRMTPPEGGVRLDQDLVNELFRDYGDINKRFGQAKQTGEDKGRILREYSVDKGYNRYIQHLLNAFR